MGSFSRLATETTLVDNAITVNLACTDQVVSPHNTLRNAATAVQELHELVPA